MKINRPENDYIHRNVMELLVADEIDRQIEILEKGEQIEQTTRLDDIRKIKSALEREVQSLRETVQAKTEGKNRAIAL